MKNIICHKDSITFENERALSYTILVEKKREKAKKKFVVIDKKIGVTFSLEMPLLLLESGKVHMYPSNPDTFQVLGENTSEYNTMKKYYDYIEESWELFKDEFFTDYSITVNSLLFKMGDK